MRFYNKFILGLSLVILIGFVLVAIGLSINVLNLFYYGLMLILMPAIILGLFYRMHYAVNGWVPRNYYNNTPGFYHNTKGFYRPNTHNIPHEIHVYYHRAPTRKEYYQSQRNYRRSTDLLEANLQDLERFRKRRRL
jgi:hypothetical protein